MGLTIYKRKWLVVINASKDIKQQNVFESVAGVCVYVCMRVYMFGGEFISAENPE